MRIEKSSATYNFSFFAPKIDAEHKKIMEKLREYGVIPTGDKTTDKATLRRIEEQKAKQEKIVTNKYLTISAQEIQNWIEQKKEKEKISNGNKNINPNSENTTVENKEQNTGAAIMAEYNKMLIKKRKSKELNDDLLF